MKSPLHLLADWRAFARAAKRCHCRAFTHRRWLGEWSRSQQHGTSPISDEQPWLTFPAIAHLRQWLRPEMRVFEWGSGGSTLFFARRTASVVAVENDGDWARRVREACAAQGFTHATIEHLPADPEPPAAAFDSADPNGYYSGSARYGGCRFQSYATSIERFADASFDLVVVDGRARPSCVVHALGKVKAGGLLFLDNAERAWYQRAQTLLQPDLWRLRDFTGPGPYCGAFWQTVAWERRA